jgi:hypothetical protein
MSHLQRYDFYATATDVLVYHDGLIDKLIGDEVMALFLGGPAWAGFRPKVLTALDVACVVVWTSFGCRRLARCFNTSA